MTDPKYATDTDDGVLFLQDKYLRCPGCWVLLHIEKGVELPGPNIKCGCCGHEAKLPGGVPQ